MSVISGSLVDVDIHEDGRIFIRINRAFDSMSSAECVSSEVRWIWERYVEPLKAGMYVVGTPIREKNLIESVQCKYRDETSDKCSPYPGN